MFYPQAMTKVRLIIPARELLNVTNELANMGVFHQEDGNHLVSEKSLTTANPWQEKSSTYATLERRVLGIMQGLDLNQGAPQASDLTTMIDIDQVGPSIDQVDQEVKKAYEQISLQQKRLEQLQSYLKQLEPIAGYDLDISELRNPLYMYSMLGIMPVANIDRLRTSLARIPFVLLNLRQDNERAVVWLAGPKRNADVLDRAARSAYLNPLSLPEIYQGTPAEIIQSIHKDIDSIHQLIAEQNSTLKQLRDQHQNQLRSVLWHIRTSHILAETIGRFGRLRYTYLIVGWVPSIRVADFSKKIKQVSKDIIIETFQTRREDTQQNVPVALNNPLIMRPFQQLVTIYGQPRYNEIDPTFLLAITYPFLFGTMFGDAGQGLALVAFGALLSSRKVKALRGLAGMGGVLIACGLLATLFGFLYGSFFGFENVLPVLFFRPIDNILQTMALAVGTGAVLLSVGFILGSINAYSKRDWGELFFDHRGLAGLVLYLSLIGLTIEALTSHFLIPPVIFTLLAIAGGLSIMFSEALKRLVEGHRPLVDTDLSTYFIKSFFELFETLISLLSNSVSFVRIGAFAVAHAGLSAVVFILAQLVSPSLGVGYWIVVVLGNLFIVGFEGVIVGIQSMRLEYYEFFSKFFNGGGMRYEPLTLMPKGEE
jgi:V/A-type H+-transporting ATPase subunit I